MKTAHEILIGAREVIADPERWTKGFYAKTADAYFTDPLSPDAVCFCSLGALSKAANITATGNVLGHMNASESLEKASAALYNYTVAGFNDAPLTTHAEVLAMFDKAIEDTKP